MKRVCLVLILALALGVGSIGLMSSASQAQVYMPVQTAAAPWVGSNTPWTYYNGDWFMNGILYYFFGNKIGWAPYYAYAPTYIVRPNYWYAPRWHTWYKEHPTYWRNFQRRYPYWHNHYRGQRYNESFYNRYHRGQGGGWHKGYYHGPYKPAPPAKRNYYGTPARSGHGPQPGHFQPGPATHGNQKQYHGQPRHGNQKQYHGQPRHGNQKQYRGQSGHGSQGQHEGKQGRGNRGQFQPGESSHGHGR